MGDDSGFPNEKPVHRVRVNNFSIAKSEVTQHQWQAIMGNNPSKNKRCDDCPVENVTWEDVQQFLKKASRQTGLPLRLPTEAEWEYAAGGGKEHQKYAGTDSESECGDFAWYRSNSGNETHPVCLKRPNRFGLCDMSGNINELVSDWLDWGKDEGYYKISEKDNPTGPSSGTNHTSRGGSYGSGTTLAGGSRITTTGRAVWSKSGGFRLALPD